MYCTNCGSEVSDDAIACMKCGVPPRLKKNHCYNCGVDTNPDQIVCIKCGVAVGMKSDSNTGPATKKPVNAALFAILLGIIGAHKFYHGSWGWGLVYLLLFWTYIPALVGVVEGVLYLVKSEDQYNETYNIQPQHPWKW